MKVQSEVAKFLIKLNKVCGGTYVDICLITEGYQNPWVYFDPPMVTFTKSDLKEQRMCV